ncbi:MAG: glycosyltransferase family 9 protein [Cyanobacteria bacterium P01_G01_bin.19]
MRILALVPGGIDNQLLFFPTLETLKQQYPQAAIDVLVEPRSKKSYRVCKNVDEVLVFDFQDRNSFADYLNLLGIMRDREYDAVVGLKTTWRIKLLLWLNGIPTRIGYEDDSPIYLSESVPRKSEQYVAEMYHDLIAGFGIKASCPPLAINVPTEDISWAEFEQQRLSIKDSGYIILCDNPPTESEEEVYPIESWQKIVADLEQRQTGLSILLLQTASNREWVTSMISANNNLKAIAPTDVGKMAGIIAGANLILSNSGTPTQLAVATGTYSFVLLNDRDEKTIPPQSENCIGILSNSSDLGAIKPETIIQKMWAGQ